MIIQKLGIEKTLEVFDSLKTLGVGVVVVVKQGFGPRRS